jgi:hypothetical protein
MIGEVSRFLKAFLVFLIGALAASNTAGSARGLTLCRVNISVTTQSYYFVCLCGGYEHTV